MLLAGTFQQPLRILETGSVNHSKFHSFFAWDDRANKTAVTGAEAVTDYTTRPVEFLAVFGMLGVTFFGLLLTPVFYVVIMWFKDRRSARASEVHSIALEHAHIAIAPQQNAPPSFTRPPR